MTYAVPTTCSEPDAHTAWTRTLRACYGRHPVKTSCSVSPCATN